MGNVGVSEARGATLPGDPGADAAHMCGCVPLYLFVNRYLTKNGKAAFAAWPLCLICKGTGVDPRIP